MRANEKVRAAAKDTGVEFWRLADALGVSESTLTRMMRRELPEDEQQRLLHLIDEIAEEVK